MVKIDEFAKHLGDSLSTTSKYPVPTLGKNFEKDYSARDFTVLYAWNFGEGLIIDLGHLRKNLFGFLIGNNFSCGTFSEPKSVAKRFFTILGHRAPLYNVIALNVKGVHNEAGREEKVRQGGYLITTYKDFQGLFNNEGKGPSIIKHMDLSVIFSQSYNHGLLHSYGDLPAELEYDAGTNGRTMKWYTEGMLDRKVGFAYVFELPNRGFYQHYEKGKMISGVSLTKSIEKGIEHFSIYYDAVKATVHFEKVTKIMSNGCNVSYLEFARVDSTEKFAMDEELGKISSKVMTPLLTRRDGMTLALLISQEELAANPNVTRGYFFTKSVLKPKRYFFHLNYLPDSTKKIWLFHKFKKQPVFIASEVLVRTMVASNILDVWDTSATLSWWPEPLIVKVPDEISEVAPDIRRIVLSDFKFLAEVLSHNASVLVYVVESYAKHLPFLEWCFRDCYFVTFKCPDAYPSSRIMVIDEPFDSKFLFMECVVISESTYIEAHKYITRIHRRKKKYTNFDKIFKETEELLDCKIDVQKFIKALNYALSL